MRLPTIWIFCSAVILSAACSPGSRDHLVLSGTIEADSVHAASRLGGRVKEVMVEEGRQIREGETLLTFETDAIEAQRNQLDAALGQAQAAYDVVAAGAKPEDIARARQQAEAAKQTYELAQAGPLPEDIAAAERQAGSLEAVYRSAQDAADRMQRLFNEGVVAERDYIAATQAADAAHNQWEAALQQVESLKSRPRAEEIAAARAGYLAAVDAVLSLEAGATPEQLASARAGIDAAQRALDRLAVDIREATVTAPASGLLDSFSLKPGDFVAPGQPVCEIVLMTDLDLKVYVPENRLGFVREGMELPIRVDSFPGEVFTGKVKSIAAEAEFTPRNVQTIGERVTQVFAVTVNVPNPNGRLRPGMSADVTVSLRQNGENKG